MDSRQQTAGFNASGPQPASGNYAFNGVHSDAFSSFVHTDNDSAFDASWNAQPYSGPQQSISGFDQGNQGWPQNPYQSSNLLPLSDYGASSRDFNSSYPRSPAAFDYGYASNPNQTFSPSEFDNTLGYGQLPLNNNSQYDYNGTHGIAQPHSETISPSALQSYPDSFSSIGGDENRQVSFSLVFITRSTTQLWKSDMM